jgi:hypothetical protein
MNLSAHAILLGMRENTTTPGSRASSNAGQQEIAAHEDALRALARLLARQAVDELTFTPPAPTPHTSSND